MPSGNTLVGRESEQKRLQQVLTEEQAQLVALYGRRRVGKTFLVENVCKPSSDAYMMVTGLNGGDKSEQLSIFQKAAEETFFHASRLQCPQITLVMTMF